MGMVALFAYENKRERWRKEVKAMGISSFSARMERGNNVFVVVQFSRQNLGVGEAGCCSIHSTFFSKIIRRHHRHLGHPSLFRQLFLTSAYSMIELLCIQPTTSAKQGYFFETQEEAHLRPRK